MKTEKNVAVVLTVVDPPKGLANHLLSALTSAAAHALTRPARITAGFMVASCPVA